MRSTAWLLDERIADLPQDGVVSRIDLTSLPVPTLLDQTQFPKAIHAIFPTEQAVYVSFVGGLAALSCPDEGGCVKPVAGGSILNCYELAFWSPWLVCAEPAILRSLDASDPFDLLLVSSTQELTPSSSVALVPPFALSPCFGPSRVCSYRLSDTTGALELSSSTTLPGIVNSVAAGSAIVAGGRFGVARLSLAAGGEPQIDSLVYRLAKVSDLVKVSNTVAVASDGSTGLYVLDTTNPATPKVGAHLLAGIGIRSTAVLGGNAYCVIEGSAAMAIAEVSEPDLAQDPVYVQTDLLPQSVVSNGGVIYVAYQESGRIDAMVPSAGSSLELLDSVTVENPFYEDQELYLEMIAASGNALVAGYDNGVLGIALDPAGKFLAVNLLPEISSNLVVDVAISDNLFAVLGMEDGLFWGSVEGQEFVTSGHIDLPGEATTVVLADGSLWVGGVGWLGRYIHEGADLQLETYTELPAAWSDVSTLLPVDSGLYVGMGHDGLLVYGPEACP
jgi:hypothetical protein